MIPFIPNPADKSGGPHRDNHHFQQMIAQKECIAPQHTRSFCRRFTPTKSFACTAWAVFFFSGNFSGQGPSILLSCCARPSRCLKAPLGLSLLRYACKRKPYLENFMSRPDVIPAFPPTPLHKQGQELRSEQTVTPIHEQRPFTYFCVLTIRKHLLKIRFERSGRGQEPSRGHKFSILENVLSIRDFTSQTLASFPSDLVGACLPQTLLMVRT